MVSREGTLCMCCVANQEERREGRKEGRGSSGVKWLRVAN